MAKKADETISLTPTAIYTENFTARVNRHEESGTEEVILRGADSAHTLVLRPEGENQGKFESDVIYQISIVVAPPNPEVKTDDGQPESNQE